MNNIPFIDLGKQYRTHREAINARIQKVLDHGQYILGPEVAELEGRLAAYAGVKHCIGVADGTAALQIAMMALDIKPGDEVITSAFTFIATGEMISLLGAVPVYVDIDPRTCNIDPAAIEQAITPKTKAIIPVSLYGQCAEMNPINALADKHGLAVIEDGAQSFGALYRGRKSCGLSTFGTTSFFPSKPLGCYGDGGACFTDDDELAQKAREIRVHGQAKRYVHTRVGLNGRLDTIQAAILLSKLDCFDEEIELRQQRAQNYFTELGARCDADRVALPTILDGNRSVFAQFTVMVDHRDRVREQLSAMGIPTAVHYPVPLHRQGLYVSGQAPYRSSGDMHVCETVSQRVLSLPFSPWMEPDVCARVAECMATAVAGAASDSQVTRQV